MEHHCGDISKVTINNDNHRVEFRGGLDPGLVTVSVRSAVVPPRTKVWYEVEYFRGGSVWSSVGWATTDLPTSQTYRREWIGSGTHSYRFKPFTAYKCHNGATQW